MLKLAVLVILVDFLNVQIRHPMPLPYTITPLHRSLSCDCLPSILRIIIYYW